jgi:hypothetical protein
MRFPNMFSSTVDLRHYIILSILALLNAYVVDLIVDPEVLFITFAKMLNTRMFAFQKA